MSDKFTSSLGNGAHALLIRLAGPYEGTARTWFEPGDPIDTSLVKGTLRLVLGGRFLLHEYMGSMEGKPLEGIAIIGYFLGDGHWQTAWVDSFHNGTRIMLSEGPTNADPLKPDVKGSYPAGDGSPDWGWRTTIEQPSNDRVLITHFNIFPDGTEVKAVEFDYKRC